MLYRHLLLVRRERERERERKREREKEKEREKERERERKREHLVPFKKFINSWIDRPVF